MLGNSRNNVRLLETLFHVGTSSGLPDSRLLERFLSLDGKLAELAFESLVLRHGPMVLQVCHRILANPHDAEDAFQATFLILATRARSISRRNSVGSWLHGVALRVARRARAEASRRRERELGGGAICRWVADSGSSRDEDECRILHEEIERLPRKYREPVVLCYLEGLTLGEAAAHLGCPAGTVGVRLMRARERLKGRLTRRGVAGGVGLIMGEGLSGTGSAGVPEGLMRVTLHAVGQWGLGGGGLAAVGLGSVLALTHGVLRSMVMVKLMKVTVWAAVVLAGVGASGEALMRSGGVRAAATEYRKPEAHRDHVAARVGDENPKQEVMVPLVGQKVVTKYGARLQEGDRDTNDKAFRIYTVEVVDGNRLKLTCDGITGWIVADNVVLLDRAIEFYTKEIDKDLNDAVRYEFRALIFFSAPTLRSGNRGSRSYAPLGPQARISVLASFPGFQSEVRL